MAESKGSKMRVKQIYTYPIKSLRGITAPSLTATYTGFTNDRCFMLIRASDSQNMHVSHFPEMCLFTTSLTPASQPDTIEVSYPLSHTFDKPTLPLSDPDNVLRIPLTPENTAKLSTVEVNMHSSPTMGYDMGSHYNDWFSARFGYGVRLLYIGANRRKVLGNMPPNIAARQRDGRMGSSLVAPEAANGGNGWLGSLTSTASSFLNTVVGSGGNEEDDKENRPGYDGVDAGISFADCAPYLVISTKSWENAQKRLPEGEEMDISKFRPNIIVEGAEEDFEEDFWGELHFGQGAQGARLVLTQNCARCNSLNVDYSTGKVGEGEAGKILKKLQRDRRVDPGAKYSPIFGRYGFLAKLKGREGGVEIKVGDEVRVARKNDSRTSFEWPKLSTS